VPVIYSEGTSAAISASLGRVLLTATASPDPPNTSFLRFEYSDDKIVWDLIRNGQVDVVPGQTVEAYDYEVAGIRHYRVSAGRLSDGGEVLVSEPLLPIEVNLILDSWWLKDPRDPGRNIKLWLAGDELGITYPRAQGIFSPLGRKHKLVVSDIVQGAEFQHTCFFNTQSWYDQFRQLAMSNRILLLQNPLQEQWYVNVVNDVEVTRAGHGNNRRRLVSVGYIEQPRPV
jgi:hypothetical protein